MSDGDEIEFENDIEFESDNAYDEDEDDSSFMIGDLLYEADDYSRTDIDKALSLYRQVLSLSEQSKDFTKQIEASKSIIVMLIKAGRYQDIFEYYSSLLKLLNTSVKKLVIDALDSIGKSVYGVNVVFRERIYTLIVDALKGYENDRLWFNTCINLTKLYIEQSDLSKAEDMINRMHQLLMKDGDDDIQNKASDLLEVYSLRLRVNRHKPDFGKQLDIYFKSLKLTSGIVMPMTMAVTKENGGNIFLRQEKWNNAYQEFFESFKSYQVAGDSSSAKLMLSYSILVNMLDQSEVDSFAAREAKVFQNDPEIVAVQRLREAFENKECDLIEKIIKEEPSLANDQVVQTFFKERLIQTARLELIKTIIKPYKFIRIDALAEQAHVSEEQAVALIVQLVSQSRIIAFINETTRIIRTEQPDEIHYTSLWMDRLKKQLLSIH